MTSERPPFPDYYEVLGVRPEATDAELRAARREEAKRWHPDLNSGMDAERMMRLVNEAWEVLGNPEARAEYDAVYFAWRAAEFARRATAADEVRRGYVRARMEREAEEGGNGESIDEFSGGEDQDIDANDNKPDGEGEKAASGRGNSDIWVVGVALGVLMAIGVAIGIISWAAAASEDRMRSELTATKTATAGIYITPSPTQHRVRITPTPAQRTLQPTIGDGLIECDPFPMWSAQNFWAEVAFQVPRASEWSVGFLYHKRWLAAGSNTDAATYIYKTRSGGPYAGHWTRNDDNNIHEVGPNWLSPQSVLKASGTNTLRIEVNARGSYLILNDELQVHVPIEQLNPNSSYVRFCAGFFSNEASEYELRYSGLTGGGR